MALFKVSVHLSHGSTSRFLPIGNPIPQTRVDQALSLLKVDKLSDTVVAVPFEFVIDYAEISDKPRGDPRRKTLGTIEFQGTAYTTCSEEAVQQVMNDYEAKMPPPSFVVQAIINNIYAEAMMQARTYGLPPPVAIPSVKDVIACYRNNGKK